MTTDKNIVAPEESPAGVSHIYWFVLSFAVFLLAFYQIPGESRDWQNYNDFFDLVRNDGIGTIGVSRVEAGFVVMSLFLTKLFSSNFAVYGIIAGSTTYIKCWAINQFSSEKIIFFLVTFYYLVRFAPLHELTQLRVACAIAFLLTAFVLIWRNYRIAAFIACAGALAFHFSSIVIVPVLFMKSFSRKTLVIVTLAVFLAVSLGLALLVYYFQDSFTILKFYQQVGFGDDIPNPLSSALLLDWGMIAVALLMWDRLSPPMKHVLLLELVGMAIFYASMDFAVISHRIREAFSVFWVFFIAEGLSQDRLVKEVCLLYLIAGVALYLYLYLLSGQYFLSGI